MHHEYLLSVLSYNQESGAFRWKLSIRHVSVGDIAGSIGSNGYWQIKVAGRSYSAHRLAWFYVHGRWPTGSIDHIDGDPINNAISNLREATASQNTANQKRSSRNSSGLKGVTWNRSRQKWQAQIKVNGANLYLGLFDIKEEAHRAYVSAAVKHFGEFARAA